MKVVAINASPRKGWNTEMLIKEAAKGSAENGAEIEYIDLYQLDTFSGCISCFACKLDASKGKCIYKDGLTETLEKIRKADALIIGSPFYFGELTAGFRALYERLMFQYLTYNAEALCCNTRKIPVLLLTSGNVTTEDAKQYGMEQTLDNYKNRFSMFIGPTTVLYAGDTMQVNDYSKYDWTNFNPKAKAKSRAERFPLDLQKAFDAGKSMLEA